MIQLELAALEELEGLLHPGVGIHVLVFEHFDEGTNAGLRLENVGEQVVRLNGILLKGQLVVFFFQLILKVGVEDSFDGLHLGANLPPLGDDLLDVADHLRVVFELGQDALERGTGGDLGELLLGEVLYYLLGAQEFDVFERDSLVFGVSEQLEVVEVFHQVIRAQFVEEDLQLSFPHLSLRGLVLVLDQEVLFGEARKEQEGDLFL